MMLKIYFAVKLGLAILFGRSRGDGTINVAFSVLFSGFNHTKSNLCRYLALSYPGTAIVAPYFLIGTKQKAEKESAREKDVFVSRRGQTICENADVQHWLDRNIPVVWPLRNT